MGELTVRASGHERRSQAFVSVARLSDLSRVKVDEGRCGFTCKSVDRSARAMGVRVDRGRWCPAARTRPRSLTPRRPARTTRTRRRPNAPPIPATPTATGSTARICRARVSSRASVPDAGPLFETLRGRCRRCPTAGSLGSHHPQREARVGCRRTQRRRPRYPPLRRRSDVVQSGVADWSV
jgi:hypothetical protein